MFDEKFNKDEAIETFKSIIKKESDEHNLNLKFVNISISDKVKEVLKNNNIKLYRILDWINAIIDYRMLRKCFAYYDEYLNTINFITDKKIIIKKSDYYNKINLIESAYHEVFHAIDKKRIDDFYQNDIDVRRISFDYFFSIVESLIWNNYDVIIRYDLDHDSFISEIQADLYGVEKAISNNRFKADDIYKLLIVKDNAEKEYRRYDTNFFINAFFKYYRGNWYKDKRLNKTIFSIFYEGDKYRTLEEIFRNDKIGCVDNRIVAAIITSDSFMDNFLGNHYRMSDDVYNKVNSYIKYIGEENSRLDKINEFYNNLKSNNKNKFF